MIRGPRVRSHSWMKKLVVDSAVIKKLIEDEHARTGKSKDKIRKKVLKTFDHIAARFSFRTVSFIAKYAVLFGIVFIQVWIFERKTLNGFRMPSETEPHFDTITSFSLGLFVDIKRVFKRGLVLPHIVAGENFGILSCWKFDSSMWCFCYQTFL